MARLTGSVPENRVMSIHHSLARLLGELKQLQRDAAVTLLAKPRAGHPLRDRHLSVKRGQEVKPKVTQNKSISLNLFQAREAARQEKMHGGTRFPRISSPGREGRPRPASRRQCKRSQATWLHLPHLKFNLSPSLQTVSASA